ncbi:MAG TPA: polyribonucleotide nucleotidyltransferase, partial [Savagea sp.]
MNKKVYQIEISGQTFQVETGELAKQAGGSVLVRYGDTAVLSTATASKEAKSLPFFPLTVAFEEKLYSVGKIPGGFLRREGRPSEHATLTSRLIDRTIRPLFADGFRNDVQVVNTVLSVDYDHAADMAAMLGASLALCISDIPFEGPIAGVRVGLIDGEYVINPSQTQMEDSLLDLVVAGTEDAINMVEAGAYEVEEKVMLEAMMLGHEKVKELCRFQKEIAEAIGKEKMDVVLHQVPKAIEEEVSKLVEKDLRAAVAIIKKLERYGKIDEYKAKAIAHFEAKEYETEAEKQETISFVKDAVEAIVADEVRRLISVEKIRPDGRAAKEIRPLDVQIDLLNRTHGSGLFTRGETQVLSIATLGAMGDIQVIDDLTDVDSKRFMHHYNFPPYSVGETGRIGAPGRREIGHGALGERALSYVIPSEEEFPYAIRVVSEVLESNGSSSQASICASSLALMAAGVPITSPVSGIAMGMV